MPRTSSSEETPKKRAPRKRVTTTEEKTPRAPRRTVAKKTAVRKTAPIENESIPQRVERKAPTPIASNKAATRSKRNQYIVIGAILFIGIGASAAVGWTDSGQIDVNETIEARNGRIRASGNAEGAQTFEVPVQNTSRQADGGLIGLPYDPSTEVVAEAASTTDEMASSTDETASSTETTIDTESGEENSTNEQGEEGAEEGSLPEESISPDTSDTGTP